ncbi:MULTISPECIES: HNH endonuclease signature motif containing protein [unclassified Nocardia]|uniref:HNH endonuclease signature motif containing protein n=1 Tax=unclassified Nocardia TaxID=2637762 RepID=UPI00278C64C0|nr:MULTISPECIES: HNH endonuclease signature motif containing protein [unclassified Nocardia]
MDSEGDIPQGDTALAALAAAVDALAAEDLTGFSDAEFAVRIRGLEVCRRRLEAVGHRHVVEINDRHLWTTTGSVGLYRYLVETLLLAKADAVARVKAAAQLGVMTSAYGEKCEPRLPHAAVSHAEGAISGDHARAVMRVMERIPDAVDTERRAVAEEHLAAAARTGTPEMVGKVGDRILGYLDPDGSLTTDKDRARLRVATFGEQRLDGMSTFEGCFDPEWSIPLLLIFDENAGKPLYLGEGARIASQWQRLAAIARDRGCTHPDCSAPATMCAMHHVVPWAANGPTDIDNLTLVCDAHHARIAADADADDPTGWATHRVSPGGANAGRTAFCPPASVDPRRRARVNRFHHPEQVLAESVKRRRARLLAHRARE